MTLLQMTGMGHRWVGTPTHYQGHRRTRQPNHPDDIRVVSARTAMRQMLRAVVQRDRYGLPAGYQTDRECPTIR